MGMSVADLDGASKAVAHEYQNEVEELIHLFIDRWQSLYRMALRRLENCADAEDAVQDAFLSAYAHLSQFKRQAQMSNWLTVIVINSALEKLRRRRRQVHLALNGQSLDHDSELFLQAFRDCRPNPEEVSQRNELTQQAMRFATQLSPKLRRTFQLRDVYGMSVRDTAQILGVPEGTVNAQVSRARARLKRLMQRSVDIK